MKNLCFLITIIAVLTIFSCDKDRNLTILKGRVLELGSLNPIEGAQIIMFIEVERRGNLDFSMGSSSGSGSIPFDTIYSDENGEYYWESDIVPKKSNNKKSGHFFRKNVTKSGYFSIYNEQNKINYLDKEQEEIILDPNAYLNLRVEDVPEIDGSFFRFWGDYFYNGIPDLYGETYENIFIVPGNKFNDIYKKYDDIPGSAIQDSFYIQAHDTLEYIIKY